MNIRLSKVASLSLQRSGLKTLPAMLNKRSTGADEAGTARVASAIAERIGNCSDFDFQYSNGSVLWSTIGSSKYLEISSS